jgi:hypothetical protein
MKMKLIVILPLSLVFYGCYKDVADHNAQNRVFRVFWEEMNEKYVSFEERNINWDSIYSEYIPRITDQTTEVELKIAFSEILSYVNDLHVSVQTKKEEYLITRSNTIGREVPRELVYGHYFSSEIPYTHLFSDQLPGKVLYFSIPDFNRVPSPDSVKVLLGSLSFEGGLIIDLRDNHGGLVKVMNELLSFFCPSDYVAGYEKIKTGPGRSDFSEFRSIVIDGNSFVPAQIRKAILVNENVFSAANIFTAFIRQVPNTTIIGTRTSGGAGYPVSSILPNNWILNYPRNKLYDRNYQYFDHGINPDIRVNVPASYWNNLSRHNAIDPVIEKALEYLGSE